MAEPFLSEIRLMSFGFPPKGWAQCNGQLLPINQNQALFSLLGTTYGGDGRVNFGLPDLRGRVAVSAGEGLTLGERGGEEFHSLRPTEIPVHNHFLRASSANATVNSPNGTLLASSPGNVYSNGTPNIALSSNTLTSPGGGQPHENRQPYLVIGFCIALVGIFPSRN